MLIMMTMMGYDVQPHLCRNFDVFLKHCKILVELLMLRRQHFNASRHCLVEGIIVVGGRLPDALKLLLLQLPEVVTPAIGFLFEQSPDQRHNQRRAWDQGPPILAVWSFRLNDALLDYRPLHSLIMLRASSGSPCGLLSVYSARISSPFFSSKPLSTSTSYLAPAEISPCHVFGRNPLPVELNQRVSSLYRVHTTNWISKASISCS